MARALVLVFVVVYGAVAEAQQPEPDPAAAKLFEEGRELAKAGKHAEACDKFARSLELDPAIGTQLNFADCKEKLGNVAEAWRLFDAAADAEKITNPTRAKFARERADALLAKVGVVVLQIATPDAPMIAVSVKGRSLKPAPVIREITDPGEVDVAVTAANNPPFTRTEQVGAGKMVTIAVPPFGDGAGTPIVTPVDPEPSAGMSPRKKRLIIAYSVAGAGVVSLTAGVLLGLKANGDYNEQIDNMNCSDTSPPQCNDEGFAAQSDAVSLANVGTVLGVVGLAAIAGGAVLYLTAPKDLVISPTATARSTGISVVGRF